MKHAKAMIKQMNMKKYESNGRNAQNMQSKQLKCMMIGLTEVEVHEVYDIDSCWIRAV
jgi:hypothetical protein